MDGDHLKLRGISIIAVVLIICATFAMAVGAHNDGKFDKFLGGNSTKDDDKGVNSNSTVDDNHKDSNNHNNKHGGSHGSHHSDESDDNEADEATGVNSNSTNNDTNNTNNNSTNTNDNNTATPGSGTCGGNAVSGAVTITKLYPFDGKNEYFVISNGKAYTVHLEGSHIKTNCGYTYVFGDVDIPAGKSITVYTRTGVDTASSVYMDKTSHIFNKKDTVKLYCGMDGSLVTEKSV
jgi:hypothetical protein